MTDSPLFREAVEAAQEEWLKNDAKAYATIPKLLTAALPYLRRMITEENAAALEAKMNNTRSAAPAYDLRIAISYLRGLR